MEAAALVYVGAHGLTDLVIGISDPVMWWTYAAYAVAGAVLPGAVCAAAFIAHSIIHFSHDLGPLGGLAAGLVVPLAISSRSIERAINLEMAYLCLVHVPMHYARSWPRISERPITSIAVLAAGHTGITIALVVRRALLPGEQAAASWWRYLSPLELRMLWSVVCAHVAYNHWLNT